MSDFYMVLLSNTPSDSDYAKIYQQDSNRGQYQKYLLESRKNKNNLISEFVTQLPHNLYLGEDKWECALCTFSYLHSWYDIEADECFIKITTTTDSDEPNNTGSVSSLTKTIGLESGHYGDNEDDFITKINTELEKENVSSKFDYSKLTNKVTLTTKNKECVEMSPDLASLLGFSHTTYAHTDFHLSFGLSNKTHIATNMIDFNLKNHNLFIYCDIIENTLLGGYYHPLLAIVPSKKSNFNTYVTNTYIDKHYMTLNSNTLSRIKIRICDDQDKNIKFNGGRTALKLHFRQKK